jgi:hypothetical protein
MKRIEYEIPMDCEIVALGDTHLGSTLCHRKGIQRAIDYIAGKRNVFWVHMGDWVEAIATDDKRYENDTTQQPIPLKQADEAIAMFKPIAKKGICGLIGNHELKLHRYGNFGEYICKGVGIEYGTYTSRVIFKNKGKDVFKGFFWHGPMRGSITSNAKDWEQRQANMRAAVKMKMKYLFGDCAVMLMGHIHKLFVVEPTKQLFLRDGKDGPKQGYLTGKQTGDFIDADHRFYGATGSFMKLYEDGVSGYAEAAGYPPTELGFLKVIVKGGIIQAVEPVII